MKRALMRPLRKRMRPCLRLTRPMRLCGSVLCPYAPTARFPRAGPAIGRARLVCVARGQAHLYEFLTPSILCVERPKVNASLRMIHPDYVRRMHRCVPRRKIRHLYNDVRANFRRQFKVSSEKVSMRSCALSTSSGATRWMYKLQKPSAWTSSRQIMSKVKVCCHRGVTTCRIKI